MPASAPPPVVFRDVNPNPSTVLALHRLKTPHPEIARLLNLSVKTVKTYIVRGLQLENADCTNHAAKADQLRRLISGYRRPANRLPRVYEPYGCTDLGAPGLCSAVYREAGFEVTAKSKYDGDDLPVTIAEIARVMTSGESYDWLDVDSYGDPGKLLTSGLFHMFGSREDARLVVTWPDMTRYLLHNTLKQLKHAQYGVPDGERLTIDHLVRWVCQQAYVQGYTLQELECMHIENIKRQGPWRVAFAVSFGRHDKQSTRYSGLRLSFPALDTPTDAVPQQPADPAVDHGPVPPVGPGPQ